MIYYFRAAAGPSIFGLAQPYRTTNQVTTHYRLLIPLKINIQGCARSVGTELHERGSSQLHVQTADDDLMSDDDGVEPVEKVVVNNNIYPWTASRPSKHSPKAPVKEVLGTRKMSFYYKTDGVVDNSSF